MLSVEKVVCRYDIATVLDGLSMEVRDGEVLALLGRNGMGKTTLVRAISGIRPPQLDGGTITYRGKDLTGLDSFEVARHALTVYGRCRREACPNRQLEAQTPRAGP